MLGKTSEKIGNDNCHLKGNIKHILFDEKKSKWVVQHSSKHRNFREIN